MSAPDLPIIEKLMAVEGEREGYGGHVTCWHRNPDGPEAAELIAELYELLGESLYHLRLDATAKVFHERVIALRSRARGEEVGNG
jgi:hypothetical protein